MNSIPRMATNTLRRIFLICMAAMAVAACSTNHGKIDQGVNDTLVEFYKHSPHQGRELVNNAKGILIFPGVYKAGIGIGGQRGTGALQIGGNTVGYYSITGGSIGFQLGAQKHSQIIMFMTDRALDNFRNSQGWEIGVDGSVALVDIGAGGDFTTNTARKPVIGFVFGNEGLMYNVSLEGSKINRMD